MRKRPEGKPEKQSRIPDLRADYKHLLTPKGINDMDYIIKLNNARLSHPSLWKAVAFKPDDELKYKASFFVEKGSEDDKAIQAAISALAKEKLGKAAEKTLAGMRGNTNKFCYQDGDTSGNSESAGMMILSAKAKESKPPLVLDRDKTVLLEKTGKPYAGCYVNASIDLFMYNNSGHGISASLRWVQFSKDGDAFSGGKPVDPDEIDDISDGSDAEDMA